jgi:O-antigen/teichoic acid export membrane protein
MLYPALSSVAIAQNQALLAVERPGLTSVVAVTRMALSVAATIVLTPVMGITGPAVALLAGVALDIVWKTLVLRAHLSAELRAIWPLRERLALLGSYAGGLACAYFASRALSSTAGLLIALPLAAAVYLALLLALGAINHRDRARLGELLSIIRSRRATRRGVPARAVGSSQSS